MENTAENRDFLQPQPHHKTKSPDNKPPGKPLFTARDLPRLLLFLAGNAFVAYSYRGFVSANHFLSGGTYGLSGILTHFLDFISFPVGVLIFNIPCMIWAWFVLERRFVLMTTIALFLQVFFLHLFQNVVIYNNNQLLAAIFAGVFVGLGDGLVLRSGSGSSGTHLVAMILHQRLGISVGSVTTAVNGFIIILSASIFGIEKALFTLILIFASGQTLNAILDGVSRKRTAFIVTPKGQEVGAALMRELRRGVTMLPATGLYSQTPLDLLLCTTNMLEVGKLKTLVLAVDPTAFITFYTTSDISGHFNKHNPIVDKDEEDKHPKAKPQAPPPLPTDCNSGHTAGSATSTALSDLTDTSDIDLM